MEEDIIMENVNNELNRIIDYCLNKEEITATEYISIKRNLLLLFESEIEKVKRLTNKNKEITNNLDIAINEINVLRKENIILKEHVHFKICPNCKKEFKSKRSDAVYCKKCSSQVNNKKFYYNMSEEKRQSRKEKSKIQMREIRAKKKASEENEITHMCNC